MAHVKCTVARGGVAYWQKCVVFCFEGKADVARASGFWSLPTRMNLHSDDSLNPSSHSGSNGKTPSDA
jgi:hypothetical protein